MLLHTMGDVGRARLSMKQWFLHTVTGVLLLFVIFPVIESLRSFRLAILVFLLGYPVYRGVRWWWGFRDVTPVDRLRAPGGLGRLVGYLVVLSSGVIAMRIGSGLFEYSTGTPSPGILDYVVALVVYVALSLCYYLLRTIQAQRFTVEGFSSQVVAIDVLIRIPMVLFFVSQASGNVDLPGFQESILTTSLFARPLWAWGIELSLLLMAGYGLTVRRLAYTDAPTTTVLPIRNAFSALPGLSGDPPGDGDSPLLKAAINETLPHRVVKHGIVVTKDVDVVAADGDEPPYLADVELGISEESDTAVTITVLEELPASIRVENCEITGSTQTTVIRNQSRSEIGVRTALPPGEAREFSYRVPLPTTHAAEQLIRREPKILRATDGEIPGAAKSNNPERPSEFQAPAGSDASRAEDSHKVDDRHIVGLNHDILDPPPAVDFSDVAGLHEVKRTLRTEVIAPFMNPKFDEYDVGGVDGVFLHGPPGTGKTFLAEALAGELGCNFLQLDASDVRDRWVGGGLEGLREQFEAARAHQPCVVLLDELDSIAPSRDKHNLHQQRHEIVNELLRILAEISENDDDVLVIGVSNKPEEIDEAIKRTGRFDLSIEVGLPDDETRISILEQELRAFGGDVEEISADEQFLDEVIDGTKTLAASDIIEIAETAKRNSVREVQRDQTPVITREMVFDAIEHIRAKQETDTAAQYMSEVPDIDFDDVGGMDELKQTLQEKVIQPLEDPDRFDKYGLDVVNGVLLYGPPGTGKTYVSRALAGETEYTFLSVTASDVVSKWIGEAAQNIDDLFERAKAVQPCILFIDEIDAIAQERGQHMQNSEQQAVNELLNELTEIRDEEVVVIATTNRLDQLDPAVTRAGRIDEKIEVPPPDGAARKAILQVQLADRPVDEESIDWDRIVDRTDPDMHPAPFVAADLAEIADEAARYAMEEADDELQPVESRHLEKAITVVEPSLANASER